MTSFSSSSVHLPVLLRDEKLWRDSKITSTQREQMIAKEHRRKGSFIYTLNSPTAVSQPLNDFHQESDHRHPSSPTISTTSPRGVTHHNHNHNNHHRAPLSSPGSSSSSSSSPPVVQSVSTKNLALRKRKQDEQEEQRKQQRQRHQLYLQQQQQNDEELVRQSRRVVNQNKTAAAVVLHQKRGPSSSSSSSSTNNNDNNNNDSSSLGEYQAHKTPASQAYRDISTSQARKRHELHKQRRKNIENPGTSSGEASGFGVSTPRFGGSLDDYAPLAAHVTYSHDHDDEGVANTEFHSHSRGKGVFNLTNVSVTSFSPSATLLSSSSSSPCTSRLEHDKGTGTTSLSRPQTSSVRSEIDRAIWPSPSKGATLKKERIHSSIVIDSTKAHRLEEREHEKEEERKKKIDIEAVIAMSRNQDESSDSDSSDSSDDDENNIFNTNNNNSNNNEQQQHHHHIEGSMEQLMFGNNNKSSHHHHHHNRRRRFGKNSQKSSADLGGDDAVVGGGGVMLDDNNNQQQLPFMSILQGLFPNVSPQEFLSRYMLWVARRRPKSPVLWTSLVPTVEAPEHTKARHEKNRLYIGSITHDKTTFRSFLSDMSRSSVTFTDGFCRSVLTALVEFEPLFFENVVKIVSDHCRREEMKDEGRMKKEVNLTPNPRSLLYQTKSLLRESEVQEHERSHRNELAASTIQSRSQLTHLVPPPPPPPPPPLVQVPTTNSSSGLTASISASDHTAAGRRNSNLLPVGAVSGGGGGRSRSNSSISNSNKMQRSRSNSGFHTAGGTGAGGGGGGDGTTPLVPGLPGSGGPRQILMTIRDIFRAFTNATLAPAALRNVMVAVHLLDPHNTGFIPHYALAHRGFLSKFFQQTVKKPTLSQQANWNHFCSTFEQVRSETEQWVMSQPVDNENATTTAAATPTATTGDAPPTSPLTASYSSASLSSSDTAMTPFAWFLAAFTGPRLFNTKNDFTAPLRSPLEVLRTLFQKHFDYLPSPVGIPVADFRFLLCCDDRIVNIFKHLTLPELQIQTYVPKNQHP